MTRALRYLLRKFYVVCAVALILLAVVVQAGRSLSPLVSEQRLWLADYLSEQLNARVTLGTIEAEWQGLKPVLDIGDFHIVSHSDAPILKVGEARLRLDLLRSLANWRLVWGGVNLQHTALEFEQTDDGFWRIPGLPQAVANAPEAAQLDALVDMLLLANKIEFQNTHLRFQFANDHAIDLHSPTLLLENRKQFHRLLLDIDIDDGKRAVALVIEGSGDPRQPLQFEAQGYLALNDFPTSEPLAAAAALLLRSTGETQVRSEGALNAQLWFSTRAGHEGFDLNGELSLQTLVVPFLQHQYQLDSFHTGVTGHWQRDGGWRLVLPGVNAQLHDAGIDEVNVEIAAAGPGAPMQIQLDRLQLSAWANVLQQAGVLGDGPLRDIIANLEPRGDLRNLRMTLPLDEPAGWHIEAQAEQVSVNAWRGVPALTGIDGYVKAGPEGGLINLDSRQGFTMHFDPTYASSLDYQQVSGQVAWHLQRAQQRIYVNSGAIQFRNPDEKITGYLWLELPWQRAGDIDLFLHIGAQQLKAGNYPKYLPAQLPEPLTNWLAASIGTANSGRIEDLGFIFRGTLNTPNGLARTHQLFLDIEDAELSYHADWPELKKVNGRLLISDNDVDASLASAELYDSQVMATRIAARPNPQGEGALLTVKGAIKGEAADGLRILRGGHLRTLIGTNMDSWEISGNILTELDLAIPLAAGAAGATQQIDVTLDAPRFAIKNFQLSLADVVGRVSYSHSQGLSSEGLQGQLFGETLEVQLGSERTTPAQSRTRIGLTGQVDAEVLAQWSQRPELLFLQGPVPYNARIDILHRNTAADSETLAAGPHSDAQLAEIKVSADLTQVAIDLPAPYGKESHGPRTLDMDLGIHEQTLAVGLDYRAPEQSLTQAQLLVQRNGNHLLKANIALGETAQLPAETQFLITGYLPALEVDAWRQVQNDYFVHQSRLTRTDRTAPDNLQHPAGVPGFIAGLPLRVDLLLGAHNFGPLQLRDVALKAWQQDQAWQLDFSNPMLSGALQMPMDRGTAVKVAIRELHLSRHLLGDPPAESFSELDLAATLTAEAARFHPRNLPRADVTVDALYFDGSNYGNWSLELYPDDKGALFDNIRGNIRGVTVGGIQPHPESGAAIANQRGAQIYWIVDGQGSRTRFIGSLVAGDMAPVLQSWDKPDIVESTSASYQVDLTWPGAPGEFALMNLQGEIDLLLQDGRFRRTAGAGEGLLRLFSLVNFDSLARRLRLDFSDLYRSGLAYDSVQGKLSFAGGTLYFSEPLQVESPSSRLQLAGNINLLEETVDMRLVAALPVAGNLTFLAAFATGLPAAAGIYLVSKIFRKQVDQATSVSYSIRGNWDNPAMKFDRLFESEASLRNSVSAHEHEVPEASEHAPVENRPRRKL